MTKKKTGLGPKLYFADGVNRFDFTIVVTSILEYVFLAGTGFTAIRALRLLRVFRLLGHFETMKLLLSLVLESMNEVSYLSLILLIFVFMFASLGMSLYGGSLESYDEAHGRWTFSTFWWTMLTVFQVITGVFSLLFGSTHTQIVTKKTKANQTFSNFFFVFLFCFYS